MNAGMVASRRAEIVDVDAAPGRSFGLADDLAPFESAWHTHGKHQLLYARAGTLSLEVASATWLLPPQRAAWLDAGVSHRVVAKGNVELRTVYFGASSARALGTADGCCVFPVSPLAREMILHAMRWGARHEGTDGVSVAFFAALAALAGEWAGSATTFRLPSVEAPDLARAASHALARLSEATAIEASARFAGLSARTLTRRFAAETGMTWRAYVHAARMLRALELLAVRGARVTDAAYAVGFRSLGAFTAAFTAFVGESPRTYRDRVAVALPAARSGAPQREAAATALARP